MAKRVDTKTKDTAHPKKKEIRPERRVLVWQMKEA